VSLDLSREQFAMPVERPIAHTVNPSHRLLVGSEFLEPEDLFQRCGHAPVSNDSSAVRAACFMVGFVCKNATIVFPFL
jgi:hypothetical protein